MSQQQHPTVVQRTATGRHRSPSSIGWAIRDADGLTLADNLADRALAVRRLGHFAGAACALPLRVVGPDGLPSGDTIG
jgi:hypothetical protein